MFARGLLIVAGMLVVGAGRATDKPEGWTELFNGNDLSGWKVRHEKYTVTKYVDAEGKEIKGARKTKVDQKETVVDASNKPIEGAKVGKIDGKIVPIDTDGNRIKGAKILRTGGRDAIVGADGKEIADAKVVTEQRENPTGGWKVNNGVLICGMGPRGSDIYTEKKFTDFELHIE